MSAWIWREIEIDIDMRHIENDIRKVIKTHWRKSEKVKEEILEDYFLLFFFFLVFFFLFISFPKEYLSFFLKWFNTLRWNFSLWVAFWNHVDKVKKFASNICVKKKSSHCELSKLSFCCVYNTRTFLYTLHGVKVHSFVTCIHQICIAASKALAGADYRKQSFPIGCIIHSHISNRFLMWKL